jgi:formylglycine-generating enzyme required for sulfatase activity
VAEDPQLHFLREVADHEWLTRKIDSLAADSDSFHREFFQLEHRQLDALQRAVEDLAGARTEQAAIRKLLEKRLPEPPPPPDLAALLEEYHRFVTERYGRVSLWSVKADRPLSADLEQVYINLNTRAERPAEPGERGLAKRMLRAEAMLEEGRDADAGLIGINEALKKHDKLVVVGAPGSGKTTLLMYLALTFARGLAAERLDLDERRLPIFVALRDLNRHLENLDRRGELVVLGPKLLMEFIPQYVSGLWPGLELPPDFFKGPITDGRCAILLDGVDEVPTAEERGRIGRVVASFAEAYPKNRYVITSRPYGFEGAARRSLGAQCADCVIEELPDEDIEAFVAAWYEATMIADKGDNTEARRQAENRAEALMATISTRGQIRRLARTPLLLSVLAAVHYRDVMLPERRVEVYDECVEFLLGYWDEIRDPDSVAAQELARLGSKDRRWKRKFVAPLALRFHEMHTQTAEARDFKDLIVHAYGRPDLPQNVERAEGMLRVIQQRSGLLQEVSPGQYRFSHATFQEYLAAWCLGERVDPFQGMAGRAGDPWWKEVMLLEAAHLSATSEARLEDFIHKLLASRGEGTLGYYRCLTLAAQCLVDCTQEHVNWELWQRVLDDLAAMLQEPAAKADLKVRINVGNALGQMGDTRLGQMIEIPAGKFLMGTPVQAVDAPAEQLQATAGFRHILQARELMMRETPQREVYLDAYKIDRYPVTNAEYKGFVQDTGREPPRHWQGGDYPAGAANHPVVNVTWHDAAAYARWAGKRLPTEAEWERAARGTDGLTWPWGSEWQGDCCNSEEAGVKDTTPVGIFPDGRSPYGVDDMAGNVWEWCADWLAEDAYRSGEKANPRGPKAGERKVVRGGAYAWGKVVVRCSFRYGFYPRHWSDNTGFRCAQ